MGRRRSHWRSFSNSRHTALCLLWGVLVSLASGKLTAASAASSSCTSDKPVNPGKSRDSVCSGLPDASDLTATQRGTIRPTFCEGSLLDGSPSLRQIKHPGSRHLRQQRLTTGEVNIQNPTERQANDQATTPSWSEQHASRTDSDKTRIPRQLDWDTFFAIMNRQQEEGPAVSTKHSRRTPEGDGQLSMMPTGDDSRSTVDPLPAVAVIPAPNTQFGAETTLEIETPPFNDAAGEGQSDITTGSRATKSENFAEPSLDSLVASAEPQVGTTSAEAEAEEPGGEKRLEGNKTKQKHGGHVSFQEKLIREEEQVSPLFSTNLPVTTGAATARDTGSGRQTGLEPQAYKKADSDMVGSAEGETLQSETPGESHYTTARKPVSCATAPISHVLSNVDLDSIAAIQGMAAVWLSQASEGCEITSDSQAGGPATDAPTRLSSSRGAKLVHPRSSSVSARGAPTGTRESIARFESSRPQHSTELQHPHREEDTTMLLREDDQLEPFEQNLDAVGVSPVNLGTLAEQERFLHLLLRALRIGDSAYGVIPAGEKSELADHKVPAPSVVKSPNTLNPFHGVPSPFSANDTNVVHSDIHGSANPLKHMQPRSETALSSTTHDPDVRAAAGADSGLKNIQKADQAPEDVAKATGSYPRTSEESVVYSELENETRETLRKQETHGSSAPNKTEETFYQNDAEEKRILAKITKELSTWREEGVVDAHNAKESNALQEAHPTAEFEHHLIGELPSASGIEAQDKELTGTDIQQSLPHKDGDTVPSERLRNVGLVPQNSFPREANVNDAATNTQETTLTDLLLERRRLLFAISELGDNVGVGLASFAAFLDKEDSVNQSEFFEISRTYPEVLRALLYFRHPLWPTATSIKRIHQELVQCAATAEDLWHTAKALRAGSGGPAVKDDLCVDLVAYKPDFGEKALRTVKFFGQVFFSVYQLAVYDITQKQFTKSVDDVTTLQKYFSKIHSRLMDILSFGGPSFEKKQRDHLVKTCLLQQQPNASLVEKEIFVQRQLVAHLGLLVGQLEVVSRFETTLHKLATLFERRTRIVKPSPPALKATQTRMRARKRVATLRRPAGQ